VIITPVDPPPRLPAARSTRVWFDHVCGWCAEAGAQRFGFFASRSRLITYLQQAGCTTIQTLTDGQPDGHAPTSRDGPGALTRTMAGHERAGPDVVPPRGPSSLAAENEVG
jgi:hypothetical protein